ncbi:hypothetical protein ACJRPK_13995 [Aquimarina sp. 2-A2]|uniref:hypothetical protein n=1 Tax=Aquimarina sp. 2-A2 TaxID=3382644 RepID=UPI00387F0CE9
MEKFKVEIDRREIVETINETVQSKIKDQLNLQMDDIEKTIGEYFNRSLFNDKKTQFENALDYTVEMAFREGLNSAMEELNFKEMIADKAKELLKSDNLIQELAEAKVRSSLGLPEK